MTRREISGAPHPLLELAIALGIGALLAWSAPGVRAWLNGAPPVVDTSVQDCRPVERLAEHYAGVIAGCLNGRAITDGHTLVHCGRRR